jgi:hypothetical protein
MRKTDYGSSKIWCMVKKTGGLALTLNIQSKLRKLSVFLVMVLILPWPGYSYAPPSEHKEWRIPEHKLFTDKDYLSFTYRQANGNEKTLQMLIGERWAITELLSKEVRWYDLATDWEYTFSLTQGSNKMLRLHLSIRLQSNEDCFVFLKFFNDSENISAISYAVSWLDPHPRAWNDWEAHGFIYPNETYTDPLSSLSIQALEKTPWKGNMVYLKSKMHDWTVQTWLKGALFHSRKLSHGLIERVDSPSSVWLDDSTSLLWTHTRTWILPNTQLEDWLLYSDLVLLNIYSARTKKVLEVTDFSMIKHFSRDGFHYLTVSTGYEGESNRTYYWDYSMYAPRSILEYYYTDHERFFHALAVNCYLALIVHRQDTQYWRSGTVSGWLNSLYHMEDRYFDTRFNVDAALFLLFFHDRFQSQQALDMAQKIGDLLLSYMSRGLGFRTPNDGMMIQDYVCEDQPTLRTHTSLNHLINEASFLLKLYDITGIIYYRNGAERIIKGIQATEEQWKNMAKQDFFYALFPDGRYGEDDYLTLTYHDILRYQDFSAKYLKERNPAIQRLGRFKEDFLYNKKVIENKRLQDKRDYVYHQWEKAS